MKLAFKGKGLFFPFLALLLLSYGLVFAQPAEDLLKVGLGAYKDGFFEVAESQWRKFLSLYPDHPLAPKVRYLLGRTLLEMGKKQEALKVLEGLTGEKQIDQGELGYLLGILYFDQGNWQRAAVSLEKALSFNSRPPWHGDALLLLGECFVKLGDLERAVLRLKKAQEVLGEGPKRERASLLLGLSYLGLGKAEEAERAFRQVKGKARPEALFWLSEAYLKLGDREKAIVVLGQVVEEYPQDSRAPEALYRQALLLFERGERTQARIVLSRWLDLYKNHPLESKVRLLLGRILMAKAAYGDAVEVLKPVLKKGAPQEQAEARYRLIWAYLQQGDTAEAKRLLSGLDDPLSHFLRAKGELSEEKCEGAMPYLFELSGKKPFRAFSLFEIARCSWSLGKFEDCVANLDVLQLEFPLLEKADEVLWLKAECLRESGEKEKASALYRALVDKGPSSRRFPWALYRLCETALGDNRMEEAFALFERLKEHFPEHELTPRAALLLGKFLFSKGAYERALEVFLLGAASPIREIQGESNLWLGKAYWRMGKSREALSAFGKAALQGGEIAALAYVEMGNIYSELNQPKEARLAYQEALKSAADEALKSRIRKLLELLEEGSPK